MLHGLSRLRWSLLGGAAALLVFTATAVAGSGVGGVFNLGVTNTVDAQTTLSGNPGANPLLRLTSTGTAATIRVDAGTDVAVNGISNSGTGQLGQSTTGNGLLGLHTGSSGVAPGAEGRTASTAPNAAGVLGKTTSASADATSAGVQGVNAGHGAGVLGQASVSGAVGVRGASTSTSVGYGIIGSGTTAVTGCAPLSVTCPQGFPENIAGLFEASHSGGNGIVSCAGTLCDSLVSTVGGIAGQFTSGTGGIGVLAVGGRQGGFFGVSDADGVAVDARSNQGANAVAIFAQSTSGLAGRFEGNVHVTGKLTRAYTTGTANQATPVAYAGINAGGSVIGQASSPNVTSTFDSVNHRYVITIAGQSADVNHSVTTVTPIATTPRFATVSSSGSNLTVRIFDLSGAVVQSAFMFTTYKP